MCECMILKFKDSTESPAFMYRYRPSSEMLFHTVIGATLENGALEFLQNWSPSDDSIIRLFFSNWPMFGTVSKSI